jgi:CheY-like chemotaxis protein
MISYDEFLEQLRHALNHIYEPEILRYSPINKILLPSIEPEASLSRMLVDAIESLKPTTKTSADSPSWKVYEILYYRYVQCASQADLAKQLSCSVRQIRREQTKALGVLADYLIQKTKVDIKIPDGSHDQQEPTMLKRYDSLIEEYETLVNNFQGKNTTLHTELIALNDVLESLLKQYNVTIDLPVSFEPVLTTVPDVVLRQALLSLLASIIPFVANSRINVTYEISGQTISVQFTAIRSSSEPIQIPGNGEFFIEPETLLRLANSKLSWKNLSSSILEITIEMPSVRFVTVMVIDDNKDVLRLLSRYADGTRYLLIPVADPKSALSTAKKERPAMITIDIMMADMDGWQLIRELRKDPVTQEIPIIVCSVISQNELAKSLGANGFVKKPVTQEAYLAALDLEMKKLAKRSP